MISGNFGEIGELFFEVDLVAIDGERLTVTALLDTGFTIGWLAIDAEDARSIGWSVVELDRLMQTARGEELFDIYAAKVLLDKQEFNIPVLAGIGITEVLLGLQWLEDRRLVVDRKAGLLTLG